MSGGRRTTATLGGLTVLAAALFVASLVVGPAGIGTRTGLAALVGRGDPATILVMREIRLPRAILGLAIGATLGISGAALQGYLRNPLAEPGLVGVSASASLGAVLAFYTGLAAMAPLALPLAAICGAVVGIGVVLAIAGPAGQTITLILAGVAVTSFAGAMTALALSLSPNPFAALEIVFWMLGSLADRSMEHVWLALPFMLVGWALLGGLGRGLDALTLGEEAAASMGIPLGRLRLLLLLGVAAGVGGATAVAGAIGFVGLVVPHLLRPLVDARPSRLLWASALGGAALLLTADVAARLIAPERDLKLGVLTASIGAPFFLWLIRDTKRRMP
jgi:iron complex transport system permease protein